MTVTTLDATATMAMRDQASSTAQDGLGYQDPVGAVGLSSDFRRAAILFDSSGIPSSDIVTDAYLSLALWNRYNTYTCPMNIYICKRQISTAGTWLKYDGTNNWHTAGGIGADDYISTSIGNYDVTTGSPALYTRFSIPLTVAEIQKIINGTYSLCSFLVKSTREDRDVVNFYNSSSSASYRPQLVITHETGFNPQILVCG